MLLRPRRAIAASASASSRLLRLVSSVTAPPPANNVSSFNNRNRSRSMMSTTSSSNGTYAFLKELGLSAREPGVCDGHAWFASGPVRQQINPATGEVIGEVSKEGSKEAGQSWPGSRRLAAPSRSNLLTRLADPTLHTTTHVN